MIDDQSPKIKPTRRRGPPRSNPAQRPSSTGPVNGHRVSAPSTTPHRVGTQLMWAYVLCERPSGDAQLALRLTHCGYAPTSEVVSATCGISSTSPEASSARFRPRTYWERVSCPLHLVGHDFTLACTADDAHPNPWPWPILHGSILLCVTRRPARKTRGKWSAR